MGRQGVFGAVFAAVVTVPVLAASQTELVDNTEICGGTSALTDEQYGDLRESTTTLSEEGLETIEWYCAFAEPIVFDWSHGEPIVRAGYCMEPGPYIYPTVFVIGLWPGEEGTAYVWEQDAEPTGEPVVFEACDE